MIQIVNQTETSTLPAQGITLVTTQKERSEVLNGLVAGLTGTQTGLPFLQSEPHITSQGPILLGRVPIFTTTRTGNLSKVKGVRMAEHQVIAQLPLDIHRTENAQVRYYGRIPCIRPNCLWPAIIIFTYANLPTQKIRHDYAGFSDPWLPIFNSAHENLALTWFERAQELRTQGHPAPEIAAQLEIVSTCLPGTKELVDSAAASIMALSDIRQLPDMEL